MKEMLKRALRTFFQTAMGYIATNLVCTVSGITDFGILKIALLGLITSSIAAGLSAVMNLPHGGKGSDTNGNNEPIQDSGEDNDDER
ncbi:MAG: hypothetical protein IJO00_01960 [Clostridia bacterium]|nr:hypothetical protein [Clostridia bacterium]